MSNDQQPAESPAESHREMTANRARALMGELEQFAQQWFELRMNHMFGACDDFFFDLASRSKSNQDQNLYFESLREIRLKKAPFLKDFAAAVRKGFSAVQHPAGAARGKMAGEVTVGVADLALVGHDQMEIDVIVTSMVSRARLEWQQELFQLHERLHKLCPPFEDKHNPFDPEHIAASFLTVCGVFDIEKNILKMLLKQFERTVMYRLDEIYHRANQHLIDSDVLPDLAPLARRRAAKQELPAKKPPPAAAAGALRENPGDVLAGIGIPDSDPEMRELARVLKRLHDGGIRLPMMPELRSVPTGPAMPHAKLVSMLSDIRVEPESGAYGTGGAREIRQAIESIIARGGQMSIGQADDDIITVVAMFFDIILDDRNLPIEIQALVSRLQMPILKVALKDRSFFSDRKHPARQLVNEIARSSLGWDASDKRAQDTLFSHLTALVEEVQQAPADNTEIFKKCLGDLTRFIETQEARASKRERRTREEAATRARTERSHESVKLLLRQRLTGTALPQEVSDFLVNYWQQTLFLRNVRYGDESNEWHESVQTLDDLLWSVQPHADPAELQRLRTLVPDLHARLSADIQSAGTVNSRVGAGQALYRVKALLDKLSSGTIQEIDAQPLNEQQQQQIELEPPPPTQEMTAVERQFFQHIELMNEQMKKADALDVGTWVQYDDLVQGLTRRCKLSAKLFDSFVFVNRMGGKVYEKPRKAFAYDLHMGYARLLDTKSFFDRTLQRITANLRRLVEEE